jgi:NodT family efflux transporter outer membrane factor (OMF) lipoprotein
MRATGERQAYYEEVHSVRTHNLRTWPRSRGWRAVVLLGLAVTALGGCRTVGPKFVKPDVTVNPEWSAQDDPRLANGTAPESAWWHVFGDPALDRLVDLAYRQNLPLQIAGLRIAESRAQLALAVGSRWPQVQAVFADLTAVGVSETAANNVPNLKRNFLDFQAGFDANWELDFWGRYRNIERAESARHVATVADYHTALVTLTAEVARTYALIRTFEVLILQAQQNVALQEEGFRIAESRFRHGATSELDVTQARTLLESTRATIPRLEVSLGQAQNALSTLLGQSPGTVQELLGGSAGIPAAPAQVAVSVPAELLRRRPDIRSAEYTALAESARVGIATADLYPRLSLAGTLGLRTADGGGFGANSFFYAIGPRLWLPIFDYGRTRNRIRIEDARFQQSLVAYQDAVLRAAQEVEDGLTGYLKSREAAVFAENAAASARRSADIAFTQYREGAVDFQRVLDALRSLLQEQNALAETRSAIATELISLYKALGGGWELRQGQPVIPDTMRQEMENRTRWDDLLSSPPASETSNVNNPESSRHDY